VAGGSVRAERTSKAMCDRVPDLSQIKVWRPYLIHAGTMKPRSLSGRFLLLGLALLCATPAWAGHDAQTVRGKKLVETNCSGCHAVGLNDKSTHPDAPPFRTLSSRYPVEDLEEALGEGISTGHPDMPEFVATPTQIDAIVSYIKSLDRR